MVAGASNQANWLDPAMAAPPIVKKTNYASDYIIGIRKMIGTSNP